MPAMTVTATPTGAAGALLHVHVLTNALESGGASAGHQAGTSSISLTPNASKSFVVYGISDTATNTSFTALSNNTVIDNVAAGTTARLGVYKWGGTVTGGSAETLGSTQVDSTTSYTLAGYEVKSADGLSQPTVDGSSPAKQNTTSGSAALTTASFTPPAGAVLTATCVGGGASVSAWTVTDSIGYTWTLRSNQGGVRIYTTTVPTTDTGTGSINMHKLGLSATGHAPLIGTGSTRLKKMGLSATGSIIVECTNNFEGGTNGTAIATTDTGSGTPWDALGGSSTLPVYSTAGVFSGALGASTPLSGNSTTTLEWKAAFAAGFNSSSNPWYGRDYFKITSLPPVQVFFMKSQDDTVPQDIWAVSINTTGHLGLRNRIAGSNIATATTAVSLNTRNRYEFKCSFDGSTYTLELKCFYDTNADGTTPDETLNATVATADVVDVVAWGAQAASSTTWSNVYHDNIVLTTRGYPGPAPNTTTGTGSVHMHKMGLSGTAKETDAGTGSVHMHKMHLSSSGAVKLLGTGSVHMHKMGLSGTAKETEFGTGSVHMHKMGLSGTAKETELGTGSVHMHKMGLSGTAKETELGTGSVHMHKMGLSGSGLAHIPGTGSVHMHKMGLTGTAKETDAGTGSVHMHKMGLSGAGTETGSGIGTISMGKMGLSGTAKETELGTGSVHMHKMGLSGTAKETDVGTGSVHIHKMGLAGASAGRVSGTGSVSMHKMSIAITAGEKDRGPGSVRMHKMGLSGSGTGTTRGTGSVHMHKMGLSVLANLDIPGTGAVSIPKMRLRGTNFHKEADSLFIFTAV